MKKFTKIMRTAISAVTLLAVLTGSVFLTGCKKEKDLSETYKYKAMTYFNEKYDWDLELDNLDMTNETGTILLDDNLTKTDGDLYFKIRYSKEYESKENLGLMEKCFIIYDKKTDKFYDSFQSSVVDDEVKAKLLPELLAGYSYRLGMLDVFEQRLKGQQAAENDNMSIDFDYYYEISDMSKANPYDEYTNCYFNKYFDKDIKSFIKDNQSNIVFGMAFEIYTEQAGNQNLKDELYGTFSKFFDKSAIKVDAAEGKVIKNPVSSNGLGDEVMCYSVEVLTTAL